MSLTQNILASASRLFSSNGITTNFHKVCRNFHMLIRPLNAVNSDINLTALTSQKNKILSNLRFLVANDTLLTHVAGFKVKGRLKLRCKDCYFVIRQQRRYVICETHPRHKQMAMKKRDYKTWILTHASQSKIKPY